MLRIGAGWLLVTAAVVAVQTVTRADDKLPSAKEVLAAASDAMKATKVVKYDAAYTATGWAKRFVPDVNGSAIVGQRSKWDIDEFYCDIKLKRADSEEVQLYQAGCDGDTYYLIDPKTKLVHVDMDPTVLGSGSRDIMRVILPEFASPEPLKDAMEAEGIELVGTETVDGHECRQVRVPPTGGPELVWSISTKDHLPRRVVRKYPPRPDSNGEGATTELAITNLAVDPTLDRNYFKPQVPEGFTKTDDFAP